MPIGFVSKGEKGEVKLEYDLSGTKVCRLWEKMSGSILETTFDHEGGVIDQRMHSPDGKVEELISDVAKSHSLELKESQFTTVRLNKSCPNCNSQSLTRHVEAFRSNNEVPVMPTYLCKACGTKSYYLTNNYLDSLVSGNSAMFEDKEIKELEADEAAFKEELKAYIIRIFASKKIMCIK